MDDENEKFVDEVTEYVVKRATTEGSAILYLRQNYGNKVTLQEFVYSIISLSVFYFDYVEEMGEPYTEEDEYRFIEDKTGFSHDMIELMLWYKECYLMSTDCVTFVGECPECGHDVLYMREDVEIVFCSFVECGSCGGKFDFDDF
ncbi:MAG: hypothetical protein LBH09_00445 [Peptococcaceae bacterium]|jgi:hypothetical protein|nr:hypothetical protein [Peptococcaceae bacterium]